MAGLLNQRQHEPLGRRADMMEDRTDPADANGGEEDGETPNVTPEEQAQYDRFFENAMEMIAPANGGGQISPVVIKQLSGDFGEQEMQMLAQAEPPIQNNPIDNLAATGVLLVMGVEASAQESGAQIDDDVVYHAGADIIAKLAEVSEAHGIAKYDDKDLEYALYRAVDLYRVSSPRADPESLSQEFNAIAQADKAGQLDQLLPGIGARGGR